MTTKKVQEYIKRNCATYDKDGLCLLETDSNGHRLCPLIYELGKSCSYGVESVLKADPAIYAEYMADKRGASGDVCERCKGVFKRTSPRQKYCNDCGIKNRRERDAERKRNARLKRALDNRGEASAF